MLSDSVTGQLVRWSQGEISALDDLTPLLYDELHRLARGYLNRERIDHTLQATALVHEAYLQIRTIEGIDWKNRAQFVGTVARIMRRILVEHARRRNAIKRGGNGQSLSAGEIDVAVNPDLDVIALDEALEKLAREYPRQARVVELRFFGGLTNEETAEVLCSNDTTLSSRTIERDWRFARAWLHKAMAHPLP